MDWNIVLAMIGTGGLTGLVNWLINLKVNQSKARLDQDDIFREMAEKNNQFIAQLINEKEEWQNNATRYPSGSLSWRGLLSKRSSVVGLMILALFVSGCKSTRETTISSVTDLLAWDRKVTATLATIPSSLATLRVPIDSLRRLPEGATYTQKEGQATASVGLEGETIVIHAGCDSLQALVLSLEERLDRAQEELANTLKVKEPPDIPFWMTLKGYLTGVLAGLALGWVLARKRNQDS